MYQFSVTCLSFRVPKWTVKYLPIRLDNPLPLISVFKHVLNPRQKEGMLSPFSIVTALVDQIDFTGEILSDSDIKMSGMFFTCRYSPFFIYNHPLPTAPYSEFILNYSYWSSLSCYTENCWGHVTWVGKSSAESTLYLEQVRDGEWRKVTEAKFVLVARDPLNR